MYQIRHIERGCVWLVQAPIPREQIHAIREKLPVAEAATEYAGQLLRLDETVLPRNSEGEWSSLSPCLLILFAAGGQSSVHRSLLTFKLFKFSPDRLGSRLEGVTTSQQQEGVGEACMTCQ